MCRRLLDQLATDDFALSVGLVSTPAALRHAMSSSKEVRDIREGMWQGVVTEETICEFVSSLMVDFRAGQRFEHELALAALAVVLERRPTDFAEEFLFDLAKLRLAEMPFCIRVARECLKHRVTMTRSTSKDFYLGNRPRSRCLPQLEVGWFGSTTQIPTVGKSIDMRPTNAKA
jgi:hypothetical protein